VDGAQVRVLEEADQVGLAGLLQEDIFVCSCVGNGHNQCYGSATICLGFESCFSDQYETSYYVVCDPDQDMDPFPIRPSFALIFFFSFLVLCLDDLKVPSYQFRSALKWYGWIGLGDEHQR